MFNKSMKCFVLLLLAVMLSSCLIKSENPLGDKASSFVDENLMGVWCSKQKSETNYLVVLKRDDGYFQFTYFSNSFKDGVNYLGYVTVLDGERYLNLRELDLGAEKPGISDDYSLARYTMKKKNELEIIFFNIEFFKEAITGGLIKGATEPVKITDTTENLVKFVKNQKHADFYLDKEALVFRKIK